MILNRVKDLATKPVAIEPQSLMERWHGKDYTPCSKCGCPSYNCARDGTLHCAYCESGDLNNVRFADPRLAAIYPVRFMLLCIGGRVRLCEETRIPIPNREAVGDELAKIRERNHKLAEARRAKGRRR